MNTDQQKITEAVFRAIDELNLTLPPDRQVPKDPGTKLSGLAGALDSMGIVNLIVETEAQIESEFGLAVDLANQQAVTSGANPFATIQSLIDYVQVRLAAVV